MNHFIAFISVPGGWELVVIAVIGLLIFGKRLPEVGKGLGKSIVEFKKGLAGVEDEIEKASQAPDKIENQNNSDTVDTHATVDEHSHSNA